MNEEQKKRLEQELRFLKESLEAGIISPEEYKKGKERIEKKLFELNYTTDELIEDAKNKDDLYIKEIKRKGITLENYEKEEINETKKPIDEEKLAIVKEVEELIELNNENKVIYKKKGKKIRYLYAVVVIGILLIGLILFFYFNQDKKLEEIKTDIELPKINLIIVNDVSCSSCDSSRMLNIIKQLFPFIQHKEIDYRTKEGNALIENLGIEALPAFVFDKNISNFKAFNTTKRIFIEESEKFIMLPIASGSNYYFKRKEIKNKLDLFAIQNNEASIKATNNVKEVSNLFKEKINFTMHTINEEEKNRLISELGITSYPVFLINNQIKLNGVQPAETIKEKFCDLNELEECKKELTKYLK